MFGRINVGEPVAEDGDGAATGFERAVVGEPVHAAGQAGDDGETGLSQQGAEAPGLLGAVARAAPRSDDGDGQHVIRSNRAADVQALGGGG